MTKNTQLVAERFSTVRDSLFRWESDDKPENEFFVRKVNGGFYMVQRDANITVCAIIPFNPPDKSKQAGFVLTREQWMNMFPSHHVSCDVIPPDGNWDAATHKRNIDRFFRYMKEVYEDQKVTDANDRAREMLAIRRQIMMYVEIFKDSGVDPRPTKYESVLVVDARLNSQAGQYIDSMAAYVGKFKPDEINMDV